jgi:hypothetical protein
MGSKLEDIEFKKRNFQPGPGAYAIKSQDNPASMKFGSGSRTSLEGGKEGKMKPGPGAYDEANLYSTMKAPPRFSFGSGIRTEEANLKMRKFVPGPGTYHSKSFVGKEGNHLTMGSQLKYDQPSKEGAFKPGPGTHNPNFLSDKKKEATWRIGTETRRDLATEKQRLFQQAPGNYEPNLTTKTKASEWRFGSELRPGLVQKGIKNNPGPNSYTLPSRAVEGPCVSLHAKVDKVDQIRKKNIPGPGTYEL